MVMRCGRTDVAANWKKGKIPDDHIRRSRLSPSGFDHKLNGKCKGDMTDPNDAEDVSVNIERSLMDSRWQGGIEALCKTLRHDELAGYLCI